MNYKELEKLYPQFKIPVDAYADYYVEQLLKTISKEPVALLQFYEDNISKDVTKDKFKYFETIVDWFQVNYLETLKNFELPKFTYDLKEFNNYKPGKVYISVDLASANWQAFNFACDVSKESWEDFTVKQFNLFRVFAKSKTFRQYIFGNLNPKKLQSIQKYLMSEILFHVSENLLSFLVGKNSDELIFEFDSQEQRSLMFENSFSGGNCKVNITNFSIELVENYGDTVKIKTDFVTGSKKLMNVPGNRFFIHYKTLILNEELEEFDLFFESDKKIAKWIIQ